MLREDVEARKEQLPAHVFKMLYENIVPDDGGNPFGLDHIEACCTETYTTADGTQRRPRQLSGNPPVCWGWDLGKRHDYTCGVALDSLGNVCRFERFQHNWEATTEIIVQLTGNLPAIVDSSGAGDPVVEALAKNRPNFQGFKFTVPSKQQLLEHLILGVQQGRIRFPR